MNRKTALIAVSAVLLAIVAIVIGWRLRQRGEIKQGLSEVEAPASKAIDGPTLLAKLFFPGQGGRLFVEEREIPQEGEIEAQLRRLLDALSTGPESPDLYPALPDEISADWLYLNPRGLVYIDLAVAGETPFPAWGSRWEMLAVYSVVNTVMANIPEISGVVILRNGQQEPTFAGHLDTSRPLLANQNLVEDRGTGY